ncbi:MAG: hypothetical protein QI199_02205 [Candidatus Korarchaeota archaeon]|nr:hypothetical protein [Candidatus Korarchaeota archaeon]
MRNLLAFMTLAILLAQSLILIQASSLTGPVAIVSNSIDMPTAERMKSVLEGMGFGVRIFSPQEYSEALEYGQFVIVLGGHKAPEGIGQISSSLLSPEEKIKLERKNYAYYFVKRGPGRKPVVVVAGNDRYGTYRAANTFLLKGLRQVDALISSPGPVVVIMGTPAGG